MHFSKSFIAAALAAAPALANPTLNVYWGQVGGQSLASYCDSDGFEYVTIAFVSASPESDPDTNYPTTNFGAHCAADVYENNGHASRLLSKCTFMQEDIKYCKEQGKKVLLSVGGVWQADDAHRYNVSTPENGEHFAEFLWKAFGPVDPTWTGPRPFDISLAEPNVLDGFDLDIEIKFEDQSGYIAMINKLHHFINSYGGSQIVTGAPQCPLGDSWFQMKDMIVGAKFDKLWIQYYNNPDCDAIGTGFNYDDWVEFLQGTASEDAELYIGLPASPGISGYISASAANDLVDQYKHKPNFGGIMIWDVSLGKDNSNGGKAYYETIHDHMSPKPTTTSSTSTASSTSTSSSRTSTSSVYTTTSSASSSTVYSSTSTTSSDSTSSTEATSTSSYETTSATSTYETSSSTETSTSSYETSTSSAETSTEYPTTTLSSSGTYSATSSSTTSCDDEDETTTSEYPTATSSYESTSATSPVTLTSSEYPTATSSYESTSATSPVTLTSSEYPAATETCDEEETSMSSYASTSATSPVTPSAEYPTTTPYTTSTVYTTKVYTVTSCPPDVHNCPGGQHVTTEVVPWYTTVCPVAESTKAPVPYTTSTVYTTKVYTVTACPPSVPNCPGKGAVTTEVVPWYTTVCPVGETPTYPSGPKVTYPAEGVKPVCPGPYCPEQPTTTTQTTVYSISTITLPRPKPTGGYPAYNGTSMATPTYPGKAGSTGYPSVYPSSSPTGGCTGAECPGKSVVTAGAARNGVAFFIPAALAIAALAL